MTCGSSTSAATPAVGRQSSSRARASSHLNKLTVAEITSQTRFLKYLGTLDAATMQTVGRKLILALGLEDCV